MGCARPTGDCRLKWVATVIMVATIGFWQLPTEAKSPSEPPRSVLERPQSVFVVFVPPIPYTALYEAVLWWEFHGLKTPSDAYLARQRTCETGDNPRNGGKYAGAYGMYVGTWRQWGGLEFAPTPDQAQPIEQTVVWIRVAVTGWKDQPKAGWLLNSCFDYAAPVEWVTR